MYAKIIKDHIDCTAELGEEYRREGLVVYGPGSNEPEGLLDVRLLDDDRELMYDCRADDEALEDLLSWAARDVGATILQVKEAGKWVDTIS